MSVKDELQVLYDERVRIKRKIEIERAERVHMGEKGWVQEVRISQEKEERLKDELNRVNEQIAELESKQDGGMVPLGGNAQKDFLGGIDDDAIIKNVVDGFGLNPKGSQTLKVTTTTTVQLTEDLEDGYQNVQEYSNITTDSLKFKDGNKVFHDKNAQITFILKELKDGIELSEAVKKIDVSLNDVNDWLEDGKNGKGVENIGFYNEFKQLETSSTSDEITIEAKKVEDIKKPKTPRISKKEFDNDSRSQKSNNNSKCIDKKSVMVVVLKYLKDGHTYDEAAKQVGINPNLIAKWRKDGANKVSEDAEYFHNEIKKIEFSKINENTLKSNIKKNAKRNSKPKINEKYIKPKSYKPKKLDFNPMILWFVQMILLMLYGGKLEKASLFNLIKIL